MTTSESEETLLSSDDQSITLTNKRVIYKTEESKQEVFLKDVVGHEIVRKKENRFLGCGIASAVVLYFYVKSLSSRQLTNEEVYAEQHSPHYLALVFIILTLVFFICYFSVTKKILKINGRNNSIEFSVKNFSKGSLDKFLNRLSVESENRKKEEA